MGQLLAEMEIVTRLTIPGSAAFRSKVSSATAKRSISSGLEATRWRGGSPFRGPAISGCDLARRSLIMAMGAATIVGQIADIKVAKEVTKEVAGQWKAADDAVEKVWDLLERSVQLTPEKYRNGYRDITVGWTQDDLNEA